MKTINKETYLDYLKNYVKLFDDIVLNKIDKTLALEKIERFKCDIAISNADLLIASVDNIEHFLNLSMAFASCYMLLEMIINGFKTEHNKEQFMLNAHKLKDYIECMV